MRRVLVVDDNPQVRQGLCEVFKREADFDVCGEAENGREAIDKANSLQPDLIVMDLSMPVLNGLEALRLLKDVMPNVPVIIYTAHSGQIVESEARAAGAAATISKSENVALLVRTIRSLLDEIAA
jgi:DNA-binding NarL/FixJ family response regulator